ncbi:MAG: hypothetical protein ACMUJM_07860 [bacterium]
MRNRCLKRPTAKPEKLPTVADFSSAAVQKAILSETLQHPITLYPAGISLVSLLYMGLVSFNPTSFAICFGSGLFSLGSWVYNFFLRGKDFESKYIRNLQNALAQQTEKALRDLKSDLLDNECPEAAEQLDKLKEKFESLDELLREKLDEKELTFGRYHGIGQQVYFSGIDNLQDAAAALKSISAIDPARIKKLLKKLRSIKEPDGVTLKEMETLEERQKLRDDQLRKVKQLMIQNEAAMTQLDKTTIAIAEMDTMKGQSDVDMETAMTELAQITERAKDYSNSV